LNKRRGKGLFSLLALGLYLFVSALASSSELHRFVHHDADSPQHHCIATVLANGQVDTLPTVVLVPVPVVALAEPPLVEFLPSTSVRSWLPPGRAPPSHA
jgi:hypothetical protein